MKVTIENKKGLNKDLKVFIDKKTMNAHMDQKYEEIKNTVNIGCWIKNIIFQFFPRYVEYKKAKFKQNNQIR